MNLPINQTPVEAIDISPEALEVANTYLQLQSIDKVSEELSVPAEVVSSILNRREVRSYIDNVFMDIGFNNRFTIRQAMDALIRQKFSELEEAGIGSSKDIADLLALSHKMTVELLDRQIKLEELKHKNSIKNQTNIQINDSGSNYGSLLQKIMSGNV